MRRILVILAVIVGGLLLIGVAITVSVILWAGNPPPPMAEAITALESDTVITVSQTNDRILFTPTAADPTAGFIFYPGGRVDARAYAPVIREIAEAGYLGAIVPVRFNLALLDVNAAQPVINEFPEIDTWVVAGHSLGGVGASAFSVENLDLVDGLMLWASFPASNMTSIEGLPIVSLSASLDGLATPEDIESNKGSLPTTTEYLIIEGGNHAQFGWYGPQNNDNEATISREEQQAQTVAASVDLLNLASQ